MELPILAKKSNHKLISVPSHEKARIGGKRARIGGKRARIAGRKKVNEFKDGLLILIGMLKLFFSKS